MSAKLQVEKYYEALKRLVERAAEINYDTVALEAGSGRGSIKKSRPAYAKLILDIEAAALKQAETKAEADPVTALREKNRKLAHLLDGALEREAALLSEVHDLRESVRQLPGAAVQKKG